MSICVKLNQFHYSNRNITMKTSLKTTISYSTGPESNTYKNADKNLICANFSVWVENSLLKAENIFVKISSWMTVNLYEKVN